MSYQSVIEQGSMNLLDLYLNGLGVMPGTLIGFAIGLFFLFMACSGRDLFFLLFSIAIFLLTPIFFGAENIGMHGFDGKVLKKWDQKSVQPFIETLPEQKGGITSIDEPRERENIPFNFFGPTKEDAEAYKLTIVGEDKISRKWKGYAVLIHDAKMGEKPYVTYQFLKKDLGNGYNKGIINVKIHVPPEFVGSF